jgi:succinyl-CoA synthetase beta subunit
MSGKSAIAASGAKIGAVIVAGNPVGAAVATGVATGMLTGALIYNLWQKVIDDVVETVVINPIVTILSAPIMIFDAITDANQPADNEEKPFPHGNAEPRPSYSYQCVVSQTPDGSNHLEWKMNPNSKNDKRKDDDGKNGKDPDCTECIPRCCV